MLQQKQRTEIGIFEVFGEICSFLAHISPECLLPDSNPILFLSPINHYYILYNILYILYRLSYIYHIYLYNLNIYLIYHILHYNLYLRTSFSDILRILFCFFPAIFVLLTGGIRRPQLERK